MRGGGANHREWESDIQCDPAQDQGIPDGSYRLVTLLNYAHLDGSPAEVAGHVEGPILQFYSH